VGGLKGVHIFEFGSRDSKKNIKDKVKEESKPSTSTNFTSSSKLSALYTYK